MKIKFNTVKELLALTENGMPIWQGAVKKESQTQELSEAEVCERMKQNLAVMEESVAQGMKGVQSITGLTGYDAKRLKEYMDAGNTLCGGPVLKAVCYAIAANEQNSAMGVICAAPTAGSCGIVPGVMLAVKEHAGLTEDDMVHFLFTAGAFGLIIANNAFISGAAGGCQAEVGSASAMAAAAAAEAMGGTPEQSAHACAIALKNMLGLVCDPVAGLVEVPCIKRNAAGASNALVAADMALSGIKSRIPCDEVIEAMYNIGRQLPMTLRETALGGLAMTPCAKKCEKMLFNKKS